MTAPYLKPIPKIKVEPTPTKISLEDFKRRYLSREDQFKYELVNGVVEKTFRSMFPNQVFISDTLCDFFYGLKAKNKNILGALTSETDFFFEGFHRRPDMSFLTKEQILAARNNHEVMPYFVIEIISRNDKSENVQRKTEMYLEKGVKVVWLIHLNTKTVTVCEGKSVVFCKENDLCSAKSVIEGFEISVNDIFK
jgi:Uma2 family endonuclease